MSGGFRSSGGECVSKPQRSLHGQDAAEPLWRSKFLACSSGTSRWKTGLAGFSGKIRTTIIPQIPSQWDSEREGAPVFLVGQGRRSERRQRGEERGCRRRYWYSYQRLMLQQAKELMQNCFRWKLTSADCKPLLSFYLLIIFLNGCTFPKTFLVLKHIKIGGFIGVTVVRFGNFVWNNPGVQGDEGQETHWHRYRLQLRYKKWLHYKKWSLHWRQLVHGGTRCVRMLHNASGHCPKFRSL